MRRWHAGMLALVLAAAAGAATAQPEPPRRTRGGADPHGGLTASLDCSACHTPEGWRAGGGAASGETGFDHSRTGFPLGGRHAAAACTDCHRPDRRIVRECAGCHQDVHQGRLGECDGCHTARGWADVRALELHRATRLPLTGMHALADCTECHRRTGERQWSGVPSACFACHEDDYRRADVHPRHQGDAMTAPFPRNCAECHVSIGWSPAFADPSMLPGRLGAPLRAPATHDVRFPISFGPHRGAACASCHVTPAVPRAVRCSGCHVHTPERLRLVHRRPVPATDGPGCLSCHAGGGAR